MKTRKIIKCIIIIAVVMLTVLGILLYVTKYKTDNTDCLKSNAGRYEIKYQNIGEPDCPTVDFSEFVFENENGEGVFAISLDDFITRYNSVYRQGYKTDYFNLPDSENWCHYAERSTCFGYDSVRCHFSADRKIWPMPTVSFYTSDNDEIYEIRMTFDDHGYQERMYEQFKDMCFCVEKTVFQNLSEAEYTEMFEKLYAQAEYNFFGDHCAFGDPERPQLNAVYQYGNVGMYCFYGSGNVEICFVPLTSGSVDALQKDGIPLIKIFDVFS